MMRKKGFTLIELLVVIVIIGILMGIMLVSYQGVRRTARNGRRKADLEQIRSALQMYHADCGKYPDSLGLTSGGSLTGPTGSDCVGITYMAELPTDPLSSFDYLYYSDAASDHTYTLCAYLEGIGEDHCSGTGVCGGDCTDEDACNYKVCQP
ncbi:MAG TPA: prepilin-type N-terminal cleavage/methylation domain-containing protein [Patescibacteria group bacterium]|nr:prepilin-type N-terminal cleavage/methylation domain-containing protein [Patescibacteria group bacterium]